MKRISEAIHEWSQYDAGARRDANGHHVQGVAGEPGVLVDPVPLGEGDVEHVRALGGVAAVVLTTATLVRDAARCAAEFGCGVLAPEPALPAVRGAGITAVQPYGPGTQLPAGLRAVPVPHAPSLGECALYNPAEGGTLIVGDAIVGEPMGALGLAPRGGSGDSAETAAAARGLRALLTRRLSRVLVAHGQSVLRDPVPLLQDVIFTHDPEAFLLRPDERHWSRAQLFGQRFGSRAAEYAQLLGLKMLDFELTELPPGRQNFPLHRHDGEEELFIVVEGRGEVRTERDGITGRAAIQAGDVLAFPPRCQIAHAIVNTGDAPLRFFSFSAPTERLEMVDYPTSGARLERTAFGKRRRFQLPERLDMPYFEGEPLDEPVS
jgi:uncharacterized cupin superfamily protein